MYNLLCKNPLPLTWYHCVWRMANPLPSYQSNRRHQILPQWCPPQWVSTRTCPHRFTGLCVQTSMYKHDTIHKIAGIQSITMLPGDCQTTDNMYSEFGEVWTSGLIWGMLIDSSSVFWCPSVLWQCWLSGRKGIRPVKKLEWWGDGMVICLERDADLLMAHLQPLALVKSRLVLPFWYRLTWVVPEKEPLNVCVCNRQRDIQTDVLITILCTTTRGKEKIW